MPASSPHSGWRPQGGAVPVRAGFKKAEAAPASTGLKPARGVWRGAPWPREGVWLGHWGPGAPSAALLPQASGLTDGKCKLEPALNFKLTQRFTEAGDGKHIQDVRMLL